MQSVLLFIPKVFSRVEVMAQVILLQLWQIMSSGSAQEKCHAGTGSFFPIKGNLWSNSFGKTFILIYYLRYR